MSDKEAFKAGEKVGEWIASALQKAIESAAQKINDDFDEALRKYRPVGNPLTYGEPYAPFTEYGKSSVVVEGTITEIDPEQKALPAPNTSDFERFAAAIGQIASAGYHMSDFIPVPEQVSDHTVVNEQGMSLPLPAPQEGGE